MLSIFRKFKYFDLPMLICLLLLTAAGLSILYSTSLANGSTSVFWRQAFFLGAGAAAYLFFSFFDYHTLAKTNKILYVVFIILLVYLLIFGSVVRGGKRWINIGFFGIQPAEFVKIVVILGLARLLYLKRGQINSWNRIAWSFAYAALPAALIVKEPDLGSALVVLGIWAGILLISPIKKKFLAILFIVFLAAGGVTWKYLLQDFQKARVMVFLNPELDPKGKGYNVKQAIIAVGSGQLLGRGLGGGMQGQHKFLPEQQTDFIFAAGGEEIGFIGTLTLLALYYFLFTRLLKIMRKAKDDLGMYIAGGVFFLLFSHVIINIGMNIGLLPVTGIPLPFFSAGGSSLIVALIGLGIAQNVAMQSKILRF